MRLRQILLVFLLLTAVVGWASPSLAQDQAPSQATERGLALIGIGLGFGLAALGAGLAIGRAGAAGLAATAEKSEIQTFALIITALGEAIAIYGLAMAFLMLAKVP